MKFLLDENVSQSVAERLNEAGFRAVHVLDVKLAGASDDEILAFAKKKRNAIITQDKDFGNLIRYPVQSHYGVVLVRLRNQHPHNVGDYLLRFLKIQKKFASHLIILREDAVRMI